MAASSASYDLHDKLQAYRRSGVREYLVWRTEDAAIDLLQLVEGRCVPLPVDAGGIARSRAFPGLWLATRAMLDGDARTVRAALESGVATPEHAAFVERLARRG